MPCWLRASRCGSRARTRLARCRASAAGHRPRGAPRRARIDQFPLPRPGLRVALLVALITWTLASGRRAGPRPTFARRTARAGRPDRRRAPRACTRVVPGLARMGPRERPPPAASDVRFAWDQTYDGLHYTGEPVVVLRVRSPRPSYWRVTVLDSFDGLRFEDRAPAAGRRGSRARRPGVGAAPVGHGDPHADRDRRARPSATSSAPAVPVSSGCPHASGERRLDANGVVRLLVLLPTDKLQGLGGHQGPHSGRAAPPGLSRDGTDRRRARRDTVRRCAAAPALRRSTTCRRSAGGARRAAGLAGGIRVGGEGDGGRGDPVTTWPSH